MACRPSLFFCRISLIREINSLLSRHKFPDKAVRKDREIAGDTLGGLISRVSHRGGPVEFLRSSLLFSLFTGI